MEITGDLCGVFDKTDAQQISRALLLRHNALKKNKK